MEHTQTTIDIDAAAVKDKAMEFRESLQMALVTTDRIIIAASIAEANADNETGQRAVARIRAYLREIEGLMPSLAR